MNTAGPTISTTTTTTQTEDAMPREWPLEVRAVFDALSRPAPVDRERRRHARQPCRGQANVRFPGDKRHAAGAQAVSIYLRDYCPGAVSFLTQTWLTPERVVELEMPTPDGTPPKPIRCKVHRCRQFRDTWFEGVLRVV